MDEAAFLEELVKIPSPSGEEDAVAEFLVAQMEVLGFATRRDEIGNVVGVVGDPDAAREIVLLGHMDTVAGLVPVRRYRNRLYGRGAVDAKGPLAAFILAASRAAPDLRDTRVAVVAAVEEEAQAKGAHHLARTMPAPFCAIIGEPSGWQGITLGYKGMLNFDYLLLQPGGHSAGEVPGPAEKAVRFWNHVMTYTETANQGRFGQFDTLDAALRDFRTFSDGLDDGAEMNIVLRLPPGADVAELKQKLRNWCNGTTATVSFRGQDPPYRSEKNTPPVRSLLRAIRARGGRPRFKLKTGTSDMNVVGPAWGCPMVAYGPGDSALDHRPDEHIDLDEFRRGIDVLTRALGFLGG
jgi:LysW-gamma-L-lysine carboxypeptidase